MTIMDDIDDMSMHDAAIYYSQRRGWPIFPCKVDKTPATINGVLDATTDREQIDKWWTENPGANIGLDCAGAHFMVVDYDPGCSKAELEEKLGVTLGTTLVAHTPRGGTHEFYRIDKNEIVPASSSRLGKHIDVRSFHSYVLLAPSHTAAGQYKWHGGTHHEDQGAGCPDELFAEANTGRAKSDDHDTWIIEQDLPENRERAILWLKNKARLSIQGEGGDNNAYATAAMMKSFGLSEATALEVMWGDNWNGRCEPPWDHGELETKVRNGYEYNTSPPGNMTPAYTVARQLALFEAVKVEALEVEGGEEHRVGRFRVINRAGLDGIKPPTWLVNDLLPAGGYGMLYGPPGSFKTFMALDIALSVATPAWARGGGGNWKVEEENKGSVLFALGEGRGKFADRVRAWEETYAGGMKAHQFYLVDPVPAPNTEDWEAFIAAAKSASKSYQLVVIDTIGRSLQGMDENRQENASLFTKLVEIIQKDLDCAVLALHHTGKVGGTARGSSVFLADVDVQILAADVGGSAELAMKKQKDDKVWSKAKSFTMRKSDKFNSLVPVAFEVKAAGPVEDGLQPEKNKGKKFGPPDAIAEEIEKALKGNSKWWDNSALAKKIVGKGALTPPDGTDGVLESYLAGHLIPQLVANDHKITRYRDDSRAGNDVWAARSYSDYLYPPSKKEGG